MKIQEQINILKELLEATEELNGEFQEGWEEDIKNGKKFLIYLQNKLKT